MSPTIDDPCSYISIKPVPAWKEAADSKLKARSLHNYTLEKPSREEVFKTNYARRSYQMTAQGYNSTPGKPYEEVGKPLYLSSRSMLQGSLGQDIVESGKSIRRQTEDKKKDSSNTYEKQASKRKIRSQSARLSNEVSKTEKPRKLRPQSAVSFVMKNKQREDLQNITKDLTILNENLIKVKMGHALFPMLESEEKEQGTIYQQERSLALRSLKDESEERKTSSMKRPSISQSGSRASIVSIASGNSGMVAQKAEIKKTLAEQARPYTPVHSNISHPIESKRVHTRIWRQLCVLHWLLQACYLETKSEIQRHHKVMIPISECWDTAHPGGRTRDIRTVLEEKKKNTKWTKFARAGAHKFGVSRARTRRKTPSYSYHGSSLRRTASIASDMGGLRKSQFGSQADIGGLRKNISIASELSTYRDEPPTRQRRSSGMSNTPGIEVVDGEADILGAKVSRPSSPSQSSVTTTIVGGTTLGSECGDEESFAGTDGSHHVVEDKRNDHEDWFIEKDCHDHLKKLLSTVKQSVVNEMRRRELTAQHVAKTNKTLPLSVYDWSRTSYFKIGKEEVNISKIVVPSATTVTDYGDPPKPPKKLMTARIRPHTAAVSRRKDSSSQPSNAETNVARSSSGATSPNTKPKRPKSSPAKLASQFHFKFSSEEKERHLDEIREKFEEVGDAKALQLHNQLLDLEKRRKQRMEIKFETLNTATSSSMHRDFEEMRKAAHNRMMSEKLAKKKQSCLQSSDWYTTLLKNVPDDIYEDENCNLILQKLSSMGEDVRSITPESFLSALRTLRKWEMCCPDVSSAIEFVRQNVVQMPAEEFDEWRQAKLKPKEPIVGSDSKTK